jgi:hypothetical protein
MMAAHRSSLATGEVAIIEKTQRGPREFADRFLGAIETQCAEKPATIRTFVLPVSF